jgi:hypothetical protein
MLAQDVDARSSAGGKRPPLALGDRRESGPRLNLVMALPPSVWQEHLRPMLSIEEAAGLRAVCQALRESVKEWPMHLELDFGDLQSALACFPATRSIDGYCYVPHPAAEEFKMVELLRRHGGTLKHVEAVDEGGKGLLSSAVRAGALPNLTHFSLRLNETIHREILSNGMLPLLEVMDVSVRGDVEGQMAALEPLRRLKHLQCLSLEFRRVREAAFLPFIPPSLKILSLKIDRVETLESLLRELPSMLRLSGVSLQKFLLSHYYELSAECGAALAQVLRICSSTLKTVWLTDYGDELGDFGTACIPGLVAGLTSCCDTLEVLKCPWAVFSALPATCPTFLRLTELDLDEKYEAGDLSGAWEIVADGRLPALARLSVKGFKGLACVQGNGRLARALEAVGGTLRRLTLSSLGEVQDPPAEACYELGAAIGKLRRLAHLKLNLFSDGRDYHAVGRGGADSGGCSQLFKVAIDGPSKNIDWVTSEPSLVVPSVRELHIAGRGTEEELLLLCCGLVQAGYKHRLAMDLSASYGSDFPLSGRSCVRAILCGAGLNPELE